MAKDWHKKHISTKWGIAILGFLLLAGILLVTVLQQSQIFQSDAMRRSEGGGCYRTVQMKYVKNGRNEVKYVRLPCLTTPKR